MEIGDSIKSLFIKFKINNIKDRHPENISLISIILFVFHFDISGNDFNDEHPANNPLILVTLFVFHFDISGNDFKEEHL